MIYCNECKYEFEPKVRTKQLDKEVEEVFFNCPECHERYTAYYLNDKIKELQKQIRKNPLNKKQLETEMNILKETYSTH